MADEPQPRDLEWIEVLEVAAPPRRLVEAVTAALSRRVLAACRIRAVPEGFRIPHIPGRNQADADRLLAALEALPAPDDTIRVGITSEDMGHPIFTYFFGRARHEGTAAVVSTARLDPAFYGLPSDPGLTVRRTVMEMLHEIGHLLGLEHCEDWGCIMHFAPTVEGIDNRGHTFCPDCYERLPPSMAPSRRP